eukprot:evm.model.scf_1377.5 EVM.evm.TU.scf_1377.5   scf_1377:21159-24583(-)
MASLLWLPSGVELDFRDNRRRSLLTTASPRAIVWKTTGGGTRPYEPCRCGNGWTVTAQRHATRSAVVKTAAAGAVVAAFWGGLGWASDPKTLVRTGMEKFREADIEGSLKDFDAAYAASPPLRPYLWQRGISLYYADRFEEGSVQFRKDVAVNPNDSEEAIWAYLCEAQTLGAEQAQQQFLQVGEDRRPVMRAALKCFKTGQQPEEYTGLWHESWGNAEAARQAIVAAASSAYGKQADDYMSAVSRVHCAVRGWSVQ